MSKNFTSFTPPPLQSASALSFPDGSFLCNVYNIMALWGQETVLYTFMNITTLV